MGLLSTIGAASARAYGFTRSAIAAAVDAYFNRVTLLLPGNGTNGAQNNTFLDSSSNNFTITRNGNTTQGTFTPFSQTGWSNYFDGGANYLTISGGSTNLTLGSGDYTVEAWIYPTFSSSSFGLQLIGPHNGQTSSGWGVLINRGASTGVAFVIANSIIVSTTSALTPFNWYHIAIVRSGSGTNNTTIYVNGSVAAQATNTTNDTFVGNFWIANQNGGAYFQGNASNIRFTKGGALYAGAFTPPTAPLTTTVSAGTVQLLTCQDNRFKDNSANNFAFVVTGTPSVQALSPFAPTAAYSTTTVGGSGYFDGTGDYLSAPDNAVFEFGTGDFVLEGWFYPTTSGTIRVLASHFSGSSGWSLELTTGDLLTLWSGNGTTGGYKVTSTNKVITNQWNYCAVSRSGTSLNTFINGVSGTAVTDSTNIADNTAVVAIGATPSATALYTGYSCDVRIRKGSAITSSTVPTAPLTAITNTSLLLNFTNAGITDATAKNVLETVGNAQISTTQSKFGGSSMYFDGTGDYLITPNSQNFRFGNGDFTIEFWAYISSFGSTQYMPVCSVWDVSATDANSSWYVSVNAFNNTRKLGFSYRSGGASVDLSFGTGTNSTGSWDHYAIVRSGNLLYAFKNGTLLNSGGTSITATLTTGGTTPFIVGAINGGEQFNGYIDDLRITKYARYTSNFTAPTVAFPVQ